MSFFKNYRTPFGYVVDGNQVDAYGVDHSGFSTRDEVQYQFARQEREKQMAEKLKQQGIEPENYPQLGTAFWGNNPENNYGFGNSNISANIENRQNQTPSFGQVFAKEIKSDLADIGYGAQKALNGLTLGGSDWVLRRLGLNNENEYLAHKDKEGLGTVARIGGTLAELGGSIQGLGASIGTGLAKMGLKGVKLAGAAGAAEGAITGTTNSDSWSELPQNILTGSILGTISGAAGQKVLDSIIKPFSTKAATFGMKGGMENIINNPQAQNLVESGIKQSDELAKQALRQIPQVSERLNTQAADFMQQSLNHKINLPQTIASQRAKTQQYVNQHAADEVIDFAPTKEQLLNYKPKSSFKPNNYTKQDAESILRNRSDKQKLQIYNDGVSGENAGVNHFLGSDRRPFIRTLNNTLDNPDVKFTWEGKQHYSKKYTNKDNSHNFMDLVVTKDGKIFNKFPTNEKFIRNKISGAQDLSLKAPLSNTFKPINGVLDSDKVPYQKVVVNSKLPNISEVYQGLSEEAAKNMQNAISTGLNKTSQKAGSLESIYQIKNELDRLSPQSPAVSEAKDKFAQTYAQAMQGHDKAFNLEQAHRLGLNNNTNSVSTMSPLEKNAFTQGLFERIGQNNRPNQNMADLMLNYRSELSQVLTPSKLSQLEQNLQQNSNLFNRLTQIGKVAENTLKHQELSELSSAFARATKTLNDKMRGKMLKNSANNLLNPNFEGKENNWLLEVYPKTGGFFPTQYYFDKE